MLLLVDVLIPALTSTLRDEHVCGERQYNCAFSYPQRWMQVSDELHSRSKRPIKIGGCFGHVGLDSVQEEIKNLFLFGIEPSLLDRPTAINKSLL